LALLSVEDGSSEVLHAAALSTPITVNNNARPTAILIDIP
jgi:hypothetical protein